MHPVFSARTENSSFPTSLFPSANSHVGYDAIPACEQNSVCVLSGLLHSMYDMCSQLLPNASFWSVQCGHQNAPYILAPFSVKHFANASPGPDDVAVHAARNNKDIAAVNIAAFMFLARVF